MKAIIVEDETVIRNGLVRHVPWKQLEINELKAAANAEEALRMCETYRPDIVITDIRMPGIDGIDLCRKLRKKLPECEIIFITGFEDKEYLKGAIELHAVKYIEKPICIADLSDAVREAAKRVRSSRIQSSFYLHSLLFEDKFSWEDTSGSRNYCIAYLKLKNPGKVYEVAAAIRPFCGEKNIFFTEEVFDATSLVMLFGDRGNVVYWENLMKELQDFFQKNLDNTEWFLTFGSVVSCAGQLKDSWREAVERQHAVAFTGWNQMLISQTEREDLQDISLGKKRVDAFVAAIAEKNKEKSLECINDLYRELLEKEIYMNGDVRYTYYSLAQTIAWAKQSFHPGNVEASMNKLNADFFENAVTYEEMHEYLLKEIEELFAEDTVQNSTYLVKQAMEYILKYHVDSTLSIRVIADHVGLTPTYLSNLFKKNTGMTIGQYMVDVRVEHAKRLMKNPCLKFYQISDQVGYTDANYFAKIFKKKTGQTPSEYKESIGMP
ncbi:MAG: response regulator [Eubacterium sp.]|nr:response regulator [Eubacterium sp.]